MGNEFGAVHKPWESAQVRCLAAVRYWVSGARFVVWGGTETGFGGELQGIGQGQPAFKT